MDKLKFRRSGIQHAAQRSEGAQKGCFIKKSSKCPATPGLLWLRRGAAGIHRKRQVKKEAETVLMENQNASRRISAHSGKGQLAGCPADGCSLPPLQWRQGMESPCVDGRSSFFQIAAFLLREGGGVSPSTLECRLI